MATRGHFGGIAQATEDLVHVLDACGFDYVIVETAGAGQSDVDVKNFVQTTIVVTAPGLGDEIQALKAGIMEIGDIFVVNKADIDTADRTAQEILSMIMMSEPDSGWSPRVLKTTAIDGSGISGLAEAINQHAQFLRRHAQDTQPPNRTRKNVLNAAKRYFEDVLLAQLAATKKLDQLIKRVEDREIDPYTAAKILVLPRAQRKRNAKS
jgi:LAO/AO transport system kinase